MEITKHPSIANRSYEDYDPIIKWRREEGRDTLEVHLPGFKKEQVKVQLNHLGLMVISGERPLTEGNKWRRFKKEIEIPSNCNENSIYASFMQSILTVVMPKKVVIPKVDDDQEIIEQQKIPELLSEPHHKDERDDHDNNYDQSNYIHHKEFKGKGILKNYRKSIHYEAVRRDKEEEEEEDGDVEEEEKENEEFERRGSVELTPEATKEICFKILVVVIVVLIIASYVMEMFKSIVAESYFLN